MITEVGSLADSNWVPALVSVAAEASSSPPDNLILFPDQQTSTEDLYQDFFFPNDTNITLIGNQRRYMAALLERAPEAPLLDSAAYSLLAKPGEDNPNPKKLRQRLSNTKFDLNNKLASNKTKHTVQDCYVEDESGNRQRASYLRSLADRPLKVVSIQTEDLPQILGKSEGIVSAQPPKAIEDFSTARQPKEISVEDRLRELITTGDYTLEQLRVIFYHGLPHQTGINRLDVRISILRSKLHREGAYIPDYRGERNKPLRIVCDDVDTESDFPPNPAEKPTQALDFVELQKGTKRTPFTPDVAEKAEEYFPYPPVKELVHEIEDIETQTEMNGAVFTLVDAIEIAVPLQEGTERDITSPPPPTPPPAPTPQPAEVKQEIVNNCELAADDITKITSYNSENYKFSEQDMTALAACLERGTSTVPQFHETRLNIPKINQLILQGTGLWLSTSRLETTGQLVVLLKNNKGQPENQVAQRIKARLTIAKFRSTHPPFSAELEQKGKGYYVHLEGPQNQKTQPHELKSHKFDMWGNPLTGDRETSDFAPMATTAFGISPQEQYQLIQLLLKNPVIRVSMVNIKFNEGSERIHNRSGTEMNQLIRFTDAVLNRWGLAIEVEGKSAEEICKLVAYDPSNHFPARIGHGPVDLAAEEAALPDRQRRRHPSIGKLRL